MNRRELKENHPVLERIISTVMYIPDVIFLPFDFIQVPLRDRWIPVGLKNVFPFLSCKRCYHSPHILDERKVCNPAKKYYHDELFERVCKHYDSRSVCCTKYESKSKDL